MIGKEIQSYKIIQSIGAGGMGSVFKAVHKQIPTLFAAVKFLHPALFLNEAMKKKFHQEATILARLNHPSIVRLMDYAEDTQGMYLIMEYVEGRSLEQMIKKETGPIEEGRAKKIFSKILDAFQYAHSQKPSAIIHRDIKPSNILVTHNDEPKIIDFGIVKILESDETQGMTESGTKIGTPLFMSPEQILGKPVDTRTDIYSLGVTLFHMVTGKSPYLKTLSEFEMQTKIVNEPLPKAIDLYPFVTTHMQKVIDKATEKDKVQRFKTCDEFKTMLLDEQAFEDEEEKIKFFNISKDVISAGEEVELSWSTTSKEKIVIEPIGPMSKASGSVMVRPGVSTIYRLQTAGEVKSVAVKVKKKSPAVAIVIIMVIILGAFIFYKVNHRSSEGIEVTSITTADSAAAKDIEPLADTAKPVASQPSEVIPPPPKVEPPSVTPGSNELSQSELQKITDGMRSYFEYDNGGGDPSNINSILDFYAFPVTQYYDNSYVSRDVLYNIYVSTNQRYPTHRMNVNWDDLSISKLEQGQYKVKVVGTYTFTTLKDPATERSNTVRDAFILNSDYKFTSVFRDK